MDKLKELYKEYLINDVSKLYKMAKDEGLDIKISQVKDFIKKNKLSQLTKNTRKRKKEVGLITSYPRQYYQADILIYDNHTFNNYKHILICIDVYSRYVEAIPLTNKKAPYLLDKLDKILDSMGKPDTLFLDNEFNNKIFNNYFDDEEIRIIYSDPEDKNKNVYIERFNGTIRRLLQRYLLINNTKDWVKGLPKIIKSYNNTYHSTTEQKPIKVFKGLIKSNQEYNLSKDEFEIGDTLRIKRKKKIFDKGSESLLSNDIYIIEQIKGSRLTVRNIKRNTIKTISKERAEKVEIPNDETDIDDNIIEEPKREKRQRTIIKKSGIDLDNIIEGKRERKKNKRYSE